MDPASSGTTSFWMATALMPAFPRLEQDGRADVCVVGGGIAGVTTAYLLAREGKAVVLLDSGSVGSGQTQRTTAHLANAIDDRYTEMERLHGAEGARLAADSHTAAIDRIESILRQETIDCDFRRVDGYLFLAPGHSPDILDRELEAARRAGLTDVERLARAAGNGFETGPCLRFPRQGQFHPLKYLQGMARATTRRSGGLFSQTQVTRIQGGRPARVETAHGPVVTADAVVVATNSPINDRFALHTKRAPYRTYALGLSVPRGSVSPALYWDTLDQYHYVRLAAGDGEGARDVLIVGGEDHKTGQAEDEAQRWSRLEAWARDRCPSIQGREFAWSGQVMETVDGLAFIGRNPMDEDNVFVATGDSGMGMTHGTIAGILLTDLILGRPNPWETLYRPTRKALRAAMEFTRENLNVAWQYTDWLTPGEVSSPDEVAPGKGAVLRRGLHKVAVYRDEQGSLHERSATCTHLGCVVAWNDVEKTWDCPCHGSRFDRFGQVIEGPAVRELGPAQ